VHASRTGSTSRLVCVPSALTYRSRSDSWSRQAVASVVSSAGSTVGPRPVSDTVDEPSALTRRRSRDGSTCSSFVSARTEVSSMPAIVPFAAVRRPTATATASSSSSSSGGIAAPASSR
jgi:hypothetical protein